MLDWLMGWSRHRAQLRKEEADKKQMGRRVEEIIYQVKTEFDMVYRPKLRQGMRRVCGFNDFFEAFPLAEREVMLKVWHEMIERKEIIRDPLDNEWVIS